MDGYFLKKLSTVLAGALVVALGICISATDASVSFSYAVNTSSAAYRINDFGQIVGYSGTTSNQGHAFLWKRGKMTDLGTITGRDGSIAYGINNLGQVVGESYIDTTTSRTSHAFLWKNRQMYDLNSLLVPNSGWELTTASSINNKGQIVGTGVHNGQTHAFLLTPTWVIR